MGDENNNTKTRGTKTVPSGSKDKSISDLSISRIEPVFGTGWKSDSESEVEDLPKLGDLSVQSQLEKLKPGIDTISRIPKKEELTEDQVELLRKYIALKETEARDLTAQSQQYQNFIKKLSTQIENLTRHNKELVTEVESLRRMDEGLRRDLANAEDKREKDLALARSEFENKLRKGENVEAEIRDLERKKDQWREKVKEDLRRIKLKERELENKYELLKRDTQALLDSKDQHILELRRKSDALELEIESLEERLRGDNVVLSSIEAKKRRLIETFRLAIALLEDIDRGTPKKDDSEAA